jgi:hypothetical protein
LIPSFRNSCVPIYIAIASAIVVFPLYLTVSV